ncbi:MAG TPA: acyl-CoA carboxylase subunit beta [Phycisphaerales bacterium]|nr:acyl-CoA carboxylase subunit beta [Phycisphaerales bacterium]
MTRATPEPPQATPVNPLRELVEHIRITEQSLRQGGGLQAIERQHEKGRLTARERIDLLLDVPAEFMELGLWSAWGMYAEHGGAPAAGVVTGIGRVVGRDCMIIANDATVKAGAFFPMTCKKIIRAQTIAMMGRLPLIYLVDSAGVFLPLQEDVFPDTDDFGRIFRNNAVISALNIPQVAAIMGSCVAGGGYLPVLCDTLLMTEGSGLYLAGPALVKAAIGQTVTDEELGGAAMHASISGTIDFREPDDPACLRRLRSLMEKYPRPAGTRFYYPGPADDPEDPEALEAAFNGREQARRPVPPARDPNDVYSIFSDKPGAQYETRDLIACLVDARATGQGEPAPDFDEYKAEYGPSLVCGYARLEGTPCGIVANQRRLTRTGAGLVQLPGVIYHDSADKAARFIMDCNQRNIPLVFLHDTTGFMVGRDSEQAGIIRAGAKMVNAMSNSVVPKIVLILGGSYGAGNYAMCGRAFDQFLSFAWPSARCAVMGAAQATGTLAMIEERSRQRKGEKIDEETHRQILRAVHASYTEQADIRHAAARGWVDRLIEPHRTRAEIGAALRSARGWDYAKPFVTGVLQT